MRNPFKYTDGGDSVKIYTYEGPLFTCIHSFFTQTQNPPGHFDNKICLYKFESSLGTFSQNIGARGLNGREILVRTSITKINGVGLDNQDPLETSYFMEFFTDDSLFAIKRSVLTED